MFELLGYVVMGWILYRLVSAWATLQEIKNAVNEAVERKNIDAVVDRKVLVARMEPVEQGNHNVILAYNHNTNKFLGQAATQEQVEAILREKYPTMNIIIVNEKATVKSVHEVDQKAV